MNITIFCKAHNTLYASYWLSEWFYTLFEGTRNLTVMSQEWLLCTLCFSSFKAGRFSVLGQHTLACFADITIGGSEILYTCRTYTCLWDIEFQTFSFPCICTCLLDIKQDIYMDTRGVFLNILHIPATCIICVHAGGIVYFGYSAPNLFLHIW